MIYGRTTPVLPPFGPAFASQKMRAKKNILLLTLGLAPYLVVMSALDSRQF